MVALIFAVLSALSGVTLGYRWQYPVEPTLQLVYVIHRHGDRTPEAGIYNGNPFRNESYYWPYGFGQLTNEGKKREYNIGTALRRRYDRFLGNIWNMTVLEARSTDYNRTKMSLLLSLAGLWPPKSVEIWQPYLNWQPIPFNTVPVDLDKELLGAFDACSRKFFRMLDDVVHSPKMAAYLQRYNETFRIIAENTDQEPSIFEAFVIFVTLSIQEELGLPLQEWTQAVYPEPLKSLAVDFYYLGTNTTALRYIMAGYFLKKVLADTEQKMNGNLVGKKMFLYSAHEINIAGLLLSLEAFKLAEVPPYGSYILFEVHKIDGVWGFKLFYENYKFWRPQPISLPGCSEFCPYEDFYKLVEEILPASDADCYE